MLALFGFLITIGLLVVIHEFGHYVFARIFNVKVLTFSVGFGPKILKWQGKHNEWCISIIPLGGYVKMLDERESPVTHDKKDLAYNNKPAYQKLLIAFAGPLFNILFAFLAYYLMGIYGVYNLKPTIASLNPSKLVENISQIPVNSTIISINNQPVDSWNQAEEAFSKVIKYSEIVNFKIKEAGKSQNVSLNLHKFLNNEETPSLTELGLLPIRYLPIISYVEPQSPASNAGLHEEDKITQINDQKIETWFDVSRIIKSSPSQKLAFTLFRDNNSLKLTVIPDSATDDNGQIIGKIGIMPTLDNLLIQQNSFIKKYSPFTSFSYAYTSCINLIVSNLTMLKLMIQGQVSWHNLGGPVSIAKASQSAIHQGVKAFVDFLALISLSLAIMNLLPIPVLDGGHILLYSIEWLRGKPLSIEAQQLFFKVGIVIVLGLSSLALYNDFLKLLNL